MLWSLLASFIFRLSFGLATAMAWTPSKDVASGYYRVHLWVLLGLNTFAAMAVGTQDMEIRGLLTLTILAAVTSYIGAVIWMYESKTAGVIALYLVAFFDLLAALLLADASGELTGWASFADVLTSGMLLGLTMAAMLLGHWYLNTPSMRLEPLKQLILAILAFVVVRSLVCGGGLAAEIGQSGVASYGWCGLLALRWLSGLIGIATLAIMTWQTLKIPNTQSATGILYVAVIFSFLGELSSQLLISDASFPL
jgi:hypothetical protein